MSESSQSAKNGLLVVLLCIVSAIGGWSYNEYKHMETAGANPGTGLSEGTLTLPAEFELTASEPKELIAQTRGRRVLWVALDPEVKLSPYTSKSVWVWGSRPGTFRIAAYTAVDGLPTPLSVTIAKVTDAPKTKE